jgi:hypothetical protein
LIHHLRMATSFTLFDTPIGPCALVWGEPGPFDA